MMEAARTSEILVNFYQTTRCYNPEDSNFRTHHHKNLKSYIPQKSCNIINVPINSSNGANEATFAAETWNF
jgi:hypothetical protein